MAIPRTPSRQIELWGNVGGNTELKFFAHDLSPRWRLSALLSPPRSGRGGRRFKSCHSDQLSSHGKSSRGTIWGTKRSPREHLLCFSKHAANSLKPGHAAYAGDHLIQSPRRHAQELSAAYPEAPRRRAGSSGGKRRGANGARSTRCAPPSMISSAIASPVAGALSMPQTLWPVAT
jgi:hypothetical protein